MAMACLRWQIWRCFEAALISRQCATIVFVCALWLKKSVLARTPMGVATNRSPKKHPLD